MADALSLQDVDVTVLNITITGWSDDADCLMAPQADALVTYRKGALGDLFYTSSPDRRGGEYTFKLLPTSPAVPPLQRQAQVWRNQGIVIAEGSIVNRRSGESVQLLGGAILEAPKSTTYGSGDVRNMEYKFVFEDVIGDFDSVVYGR